MFGFLLPLSLMSYREHFRTQLRELPDVKVSEPLTYDARITAEAVYCIPIRSVDPVELKLLQGS